MSLLDSFFLDPAPFDDAIALRTNSYPTLFTYAVPSDPGANGDVYPAVPGTPGGNFSAKWQVRHLVIENNLFELVANIHPTGDGPPTGIRLAGANFGPVYTFIQAVIRDNVIRQVDDAADTTPFPTGITFSSCGSAIVEDNTINMYYPINFDNSSLAVDCSNNATPSGVMLRGFNGSTQRYSDELATKIEDTLCISI